MLVTNGNLSSNITLSNSMDCRIDQSLLLIEQKVTGTGADECAYCLALAPVARQVPMLSQSVININAGLRYILCTVDSTQNGNKSLYQ